MAALWVLNAFESGGMQERELANSALRFPHVGGSSFDQKKYPY